MLKARCRRFRRRFTPADPGGAAARVPDERVEHRRECPDCNAYAAALEQAAAPLPLPGSLAARLGAIGRAPEVTEPPLVEPLPLLPLPPTLDARLRAIARRRARTPPFWARSLRSTVAASLLLSVLVTGLAGVPEPPRLVGELERGLVLTGGAVGSHGRALMATVTSTAVARYHRGRAAVEASLIELTARIENPRAGDEPALPHPENDR